MQNSREKLTKIRTDILNKYFGDNRSDITPTNDDINRLHDEVRKIGYVSTVCPDEEVKRAIKELKKIRRELKRMFRKSKKKHSIVKSSQQ